MKQQSINGMLSAENDALKKKIKSLQAEVQQLKKESSSEDDDFLSMLFRLFVFFFIAVSIYPLFKLGWFILTLQMK